jgi:thiosulfate/3-mercaptopyruvate sulfurtransferase
MEYLYRTTCLLLLIACSACGPAHTPEELVVSPETVIIAEVPASSLLLSVAEVKARLAKANTIKILEISKADKYAQGHLSGAMNLWRGDYENHTDYPYSGMMASREQMAELLGKQGITAETDIVLYDTNGSVDAMRVLWILRNYGHPTVFVINGGKTAWKLAGYPLSTEQVLPGEATVYRFPEPANTDKVATMEDVLAALTDTNTILLDTREPEEFFGKPYIHNGKLLYYKAGAYASGCIPGAVYMNWSDAVDLEGDHCFKSIAMLRYNVAKKGLNPNKKIITYCQSGVRSAHTTFVLSELLGFPNVKNYDGSWVEWTYYYQNGRQVPIEHHTTEEGVRLEHERLLAILELEE